MLPIEWIEKIFKVLTVRYGREFLDRWNGIPLDAVKRDWAECLAGFETHGEAIGFALENLPEGKPPTSHEFRSICRKAPAAQPLRLDSPNPTAEVVRRHLAQQAAIKAQVSKAPSVRSKEWAHRILRRAEAGENLSHYVLSSAKQALRMTTSQSV